MAYPSELFLVVKSRKGKTKPLERRKYKKCLFSLFLWQLIYSIDTTCLVYDAQCSLDCGMELFIFPALQGFTQ